MKKLLLLLFVFLSGVALLFFGRSVGKDRDDLLKNGARAEATITNLTTSRGSKGKTKYVLEAAFKPAKGGEAAAKCYLTKTKWQALKVGEPVGVVYDTNDPGRNLLEIADDGAVTLYIVGGIMAGIGGLGIAIPILGAVLFGRKKGRF
jgi:hypothetical protein